MKLKTLVFTGVVYLMSMAGFLTKAWALSPALYSGGTEAATETGTDPEFLGKEVDLLHVTSDAMSGFSDFGLGLDDKNQILFLKYTPEGEASKQIDLPTLATGYVLLEKSGFKVITLKSDNLHPTEGGIIQIVYLSNAITRSFETFTMDLMRAGDRWFLQHDGVEIKNMFLQKRTFFGQVIGIEKVIVN